jgi:FdhD protein
MSTVRLDNPSTLSVEINSVKGKENFTHMDTLAVEEPLEIRISYGPVKARVKKSISITMRTPGNDFELATGFLFTEGILQTLEQLHQIEFCGPTGNVVRLELHPDMEFDLKRLERHFYTSSSCGVCGKSSIEALRTQNQFSQMKLSETDFSVRSEVINELPKVLRESQGIFDSTGGLHACARFDHLGRLLAVREDVGRHNALDKLIGHSFLNDNLPLRKEILLVSGRASFELVQKAAMAGFQFFAAVGAPSSLAVELARENNMTLLGFVRDQRFNIYTGSQRVMQ